MQARHALSEGLSPATLICHANNLISDKGRISMICPPFWLEKLLQIADLNQLYLQRLTHVKGNAEVSEKRILIEFGKEKIQLKESYLQLESQRGVPTEEYRILTKDFYLKF